MAAKFSLNKNISKIVIPYFFIFISLFVASCGNSSNTSSTPPPDGSAPVEPNEGGANTLSAKIIKPKCAEGSVDFCVYEKLTNYQAAQIIFTPTKDFATYTKLSLIPDKDTNASEWSVSSCPTMITISKPCKVTLTFNPKTATQGTKTLTLKYSYINNKNLLISSEPITLTYQALSLIGTSITPPFAIKNLSIVSKSSILGSHIMMLTKNHKLFTSFAPTEPLSDISQYNAIQLKDDSVHIIAKQTITKDNLHTSLILYNSSHQKGPWQDLSSLPLLFDKEKLMGAVVGSEGSVYGCSSQGRIYFLDSSEGTLKLLYSMSNHTDIDKCYIDSSTGNDIIYTISLENLFNKYLCAINLNEQSENCFPQKIGTNNIMVEHILFSQGKVIVQTGDSGIIDSLSRSITVYSSNDNSSVNIASSENIIPYSPVYDILNGILYYVTINADKIYTLKSINVADGTLNWTKEFAATEVISAPLLSASSKIIVTTTNGKVYAFSKDKSSAFSTDYFSFPGTNIFYTDAITVDSSSHSLFIPSQSNVLNNLSIHW